MPKYDMRHIHFNFFFVIACSALIGSIECVIYPVLFIVSNCLFVTFWKNWKVILKRARLLQLCYPSLNFRSLSAKRISSDDESTHLDSSYRLVSHCL